MSPELTTISNLIRNGIYIFSTHAYERLSSRGIRIGQFETAVGADAPVIIEDYPLDRRGYSCLILGWYEPDEPLHTQIALVEGDSRAKVITAYRPDLLKWYDDFRRRR